MRCAWTLHLKRLTKTEEQIFFEKLFQSRFNIVWQWQKKNKLDKWNSGWGGRGRYYYQNCDISHLWWVLFTHKHTHTHTQMSREYILACRKKAFLSSLRLSISQWWPLSLQQSAYSFFGVEPSPDMKKGGRERWKYVTTAIDPITGQTKRWTF
jgi:hypothetical protein